VWRMRVVDVLAQREKLVEEARGGRGQGYMPDMAVLRRLKDAQTAQAVGGTRPIEVVDGAREGNQPCFPVEVPACEERLEVGGRSGRGLLAKWSHSIPRLLQLPGGIYMDYTLGQQRLLGSGRCRAEDELVYGQSQFHGQQKQR